MRFTAVYGKVQEGYIRICRRIARRDLMLRSIDPEQEAKWQTTN